jgi:hypothetical protein
MIMKKFAEMDEMRQRNNNTADEPLNEQQLKELFQKTVRKKKKKKKKKKLYITES